MFGADVEKAAGIAQLTDFIETLIFDDSFFALDYKTDRKLRAMLETEMADTAKIIVAQRISTIRKLRINILMTFVQNFVTVTISQRITQTLRSDSVHKLNCLPLGYFHKNTVGEVLSKITNDTSTLGQGLNQSIGNLDSAISLFIGCLVMMFRSNVRMSIVAIVTTIVGFAFMVVFAADIIFSIHRPNVGLGITFLNGWV